jgi:hypothetical protein
MAQLLLPQPVRKLSNVIEGRDLNPIWGFKSQLALKI